MTKLTERVQKPYRYFGGEFNTPNINKPHNTKFCMCVPDSYEVGMSNLGVRILYYLFNSMDNVVCERCFAPFADYQEYLKENNQLLASIETQTPLKDFDFVGFSLQFEMCYSNVFLMLELAGIPVLTEERGEEFPFIVGGGPSGVEIAGAIAEMKQHVLPKDYPDMDTNLLHIHLIQGDDRLLTGMGPKASKKSLEFLQKLGVNVKLSTFVKDYKDNAVYMSDGTSIQTKNLIWVGGVNCEPIIGIKKEQMGRGFRILVDKYNKVVNSSNIFAIGDIALMENSDANYPHGHPQMAQPAIQQGALLAKNIIKLAKNKTNLKEFSYNDLGSMATIGKNKAVAEIGKMKFYGFFAWLLWMGVHLVSILGIRNKIFVFMDWIWSYFTYDRSNRMILQSFKSRGLKDLEKFQKTNHWGDIKNHEHRE